MISGFSVLSALILYSIMLAAICALRRCTSFLERGGAPVLLLAAALATLRLLLPIEIPLTYTIRSWNVLGTVLNFFRAHPAFTRLLLVIWGVGAVVVTGKDVIDLYRAHKRCREYVTVENRSVQEIAKRLSVPCPVLVSPAVKVPYVVGIFRHTIYLPDTERSEKEIEFTLAHEAQHIRTHDAQIKLFFGILSAVMWWNPVAYWFRREIDALLELRCDRKMTGRMGKDENQQYAQMLAKMARELVQREQVPALALDESSAAGGSNILAQRINVVAARKSNAPRWNILTVLQVAVVIVLFLLSYLMVVQPAITPSDVYFQNDSETNYEENHEGPDIAGGTTGAFIFKEANGRYQLCIDYKFNRYLTEDEVLSEEYKDLYIFEEGEQG